MNPLRVSDSPKLANAFDNFAIGKREVLNETTFRKCIAIERKRSERTEAPFLLMLTDVEDEPGSKAAQHVLDRILSVLLVASRDTDVIGWHREGATVGALFTGLLVTDKNLIVTAILKRISNLLRDELTVDQFNQVNLSFHFFPDDCDLSDADGSATMACYPGSINPKEPWQLVVKRGIDLVAGAMLLALLSPLLLMIAIAIKLTSKGPVLIRQKRVGQHGKFFTVLKFCSAHSNNDASENREHMTKLIKYEAERRSTGKGEKVYKLTNDCHMTPIGRFLRRTGLDELPQIFHILTGKMSLVGPRPAIPHELAAYKAWHRRRILEAKPGITGLWQVSGRSLVEFDEMMRMDLRYANSWSLWLDLKILLMTPIAVIRGARAY